MTTRRSRFAALTLLAAVLVSACQPDPNSPEAQAVTASDAHVKQLSVDEIIERHFGTAAGQARQIVKCESGFDPGAVSHTNDHGLFQINAVHRGTWVDVTGTGWENRYDPELNTIYAKYLYDREGWRPWSCRKVL